MASSALGGWGWGFAGSDGAAPGASYVSKVLSYSPIAYWALDEASGAAVCRVNAAQNGTHTAVTLGQTGIGDVEQGPEMQVAASCVAVDGRDQIVPGKNSFNIENEISQMRDLYAHVVDQG